MDHIDLEKVIDPTALESFKERLKTADKGQDIERVIEAIILYGYTLGIENYKEIGNHQVRYKVK